MPRDFDMVIDIFPEDLFIIKHDNRIIPAEDTKNN